MVRTSKLIALLYSTIVVVAVGAFQGTVLQHNVQQKSSSSSSSSSNTARFATWSDSKAVMDYQNFLQSGKQEVERTGDQPSVIITSDEGSSPALTQALIKMGMGDDIVLTADQEMPAEVGGKTEFPVYITLAPWEITDFLVNLDDSYMDRSSDFVFFSGGLSFGNLEDVLKERGYCRDAMTQCLISGMKLFPDMPDRRPEDLSVNLGLDAQGEEKIAGSCTACGKWAGSIAERLTQNQITCDVDFYREWRRKMWERSFLDAIFHLCGAVRAESTNLAQVATYYEQEASDLLWDCSQLLRGWRAVTLLYGFEERLFGIAEMTGKDEDCELSEQMFPYVWDFNVFMESKDIVDYLVYAKEEMKLIPNIEHKSFGKSDEEFKSRMRQGNLRADGVL